MYHQDRRWCVQAVSSAEELADKLLSYSWCCCGFELDGHLWLNDSTSPDAVQEYAVVSKPADASGEYCQVESISVSWCKRQELLVYIRAIQQDDPIPPAGNGPVVVTHAAAQLCQALGGTGRPQGFVVHPRIESSSDHGRCCHCA